MANNPFFASLRKQLSQGELEASYEQLVAWLERSPEYAELANMARINQAELYQVKAEMLKGVLSNEEARRAYNQLTDKALQIIRLVEAGKTSLEARPPHRHAWRYYLVGGVVALAVVALGVWLYLSETQECPRFGKEVQVRVLILPFKDAGPDYDPAIDIMDELNDWIERSPRLSAEAIATVHKRFDIEANYPNSAEAIALMRRCDVQMLVWGKVRKRPNGSQALDVRYRLIGGTGGSLAADTAVQRLLAATEEASLTSEPPVIGCMLYIALSNYRRVPVLSDALRVLQESLATLASKDKSTPASVDTTASLLLADHYILNNQPEEAIAEYNKVLEYYPDHQTAHLKRGVLYLQTAQYEAAARDLEAVPHLDTTLLPAFRQVRIEAFLKSSQPEKARQELDQARREGALPVEHIKDKEQEVRDSIAAMEIRREQLERLATRTNDPKARIGAARANLALGNADRASQLASKVLRQNPRDTHAVKVAIAAELQKGDTTRAVNVLEQAERKGATVKGIRPELRRIIQKDSLRLHQQ